uniref:Ig-like domain-containing protein n=1 Tax=Loxodonta africana TaxID=9785 RepID=G3UIH3_LOXAF
MSVFSSFCFQILSSSTEHMDAGVTQTPRHTVAEMGQEVTLRYEPTSSHNTLFWYRQTSVLGLELLAFFQNQAAIEQAEMLKDRLSAEMPDESFSTLKIQRVERGDSALYLCASSRA